MKRLLLLVPALLLGLLIGGCAGSDDSNPASPEDSNLIQASAIPTESELRERLDLNEDQWTSLLAALGEWRGAETRDGNGEGDGDPEEFRRVRHERLQAFLTSSAAILDADQMVELIELIAERRETMHAKRREQMADQGQGRGPHGDRPGRGPHGDRPGRGPMGDRPGGMGHGSGQGDGPGAGPLHGVLADLDLSQQQQDAIHEFMAGWRERMHEAMGDPEAKRELRREMHEAMQEFLEGILTAEQLAEVEALHEAKRVERCERRLERIAESGEQRLDFLVAVLQLSEDQSAQLATILDEARQAALDLVGDCDTPPEDSEALREALKELRAETEDAIRAILDEDQLKIFEALQKLRPQGGRRGPGAGRHGPRSR